MKIEIELNPQMLQDLQRFRRAGMRLKGAVSDEELDQVRRDYAMACAYVAFNMDFALAEAGFDNPYEKSPQLNAASK